MLSLLVFFADFMQQIETVTSPPGCPYQQGRNMMGSLRAILDVSHVSREH